MGALAAEAHVTHAAAGSRAGVARMDDSGRGGIVHVSGRAVRVVAHVPWLMSTPGMGSPWLMCRDICTAT